MDMQQPANTNPQADPQTVQAEEIAAHKTHTSKGERLFNWLTYGGVAGLGTFIATIPIAFWAKYKGGAKVFESMSQGLRNSGVSAAATTDIMMTTATMQGGNATVIPVKVLESYKPAIVEKFNRMLGDKSGDASVDKEPEQTWGSLALSRFAAWSAVLIGFRGTKMIIGEQKFAKFEDKFAEHVVCKPLGKTTHIPGLAKIEANETKAFRYGKIAALDVFATVAASALLFVASRFFAKANPKWKARDLPENDDAKTAAAPAAIEMPASENANTFTSATQPRATNFTEALANQKAAAESSQAMTP